MDHKSRWLHVQKSHWKPTISNCHKTRYYVRYMSAIKVYAESEPSTLCSSKKDSKILTRNISWASKKQATVAQSSAEAEYIAAAATSNHAIWLRRILEDIGEKQEEPTTIYCDNKSAIAITKNPVQHSRTKHIDIKYHSLREATTRGEIELKLPYDDSVFMFKHFGTCVYVNSIYEATVVEEEPFKNYFHWGSIVTKRVDALWELVRSFLLPRMFGPDYKETLLLKIFRTVGPVFPGLPAHGLQDYINATRLATY
ncbi:UNVERIFIED_CONTAM: Retrovirus-related Pol polyprotein from transposon TNT 1-94 [Sesamum calycinum]|uniref:Retrovirus-related Pol polyprotein from transposon TNT 1-94 n=1 Tax=Sesamum calycinum TaxID=2727403 RepID=A0AAW2RPZ2_9LAMI